MRKVFLIERNFRAQITYASAFGWTPMKVGAYRLSSHEEAEEFLPSVTGGPGTLRIIETHMAEDA